MSRVLKGHKSYLVSYDLETTGLDHKVNGVVQIAMIFEKNGEVVDAYNSYVNCATYKRDVGINPVAMGINGIKVEDIESFPSVQQVVAEIGAILIKHYGSYKCKLQGYNNTSFDKYFLQEMYEQTDYDYDVFFHYKQLDTFEVLKWLQFNGLIPKTFNQKLVTALVEYGICSQEQVDDNAHDAFFDIHMTKELDKWLINHITKEIE